MLVLVDGDIVGYRCAAAAEKFSVTIAVEWCNNLMEEILSATGATSYKVFLSGPKETNFRYKVDPLYKDNRKDLIKPIYLNQTKEFLVTNWKAETTNGYEADDALGMEQKESGTCIASIDKDLLQVPGTHYNFVKKEFRTVTPDQGLKAFYTQTLVGDTSDGIVGVRGLGPVKAAKLLDPLLPEEYYNACREQYNDDIRYHKNCRLLWIWRSPGDVWSYDKGVHRGCEDDKGKESSVQDWEHQPRDFDTHTTPDMPGFDSSGKVIPYFGIDD